MFIKILPHLKYKSCAPLLALCKYCTMVEVTKECEYCLDSIYSVHQAGAVLHLHASIYK